MERHRLIYPPCHGLLPQVGFARPGEDSSCPLEQCNLPRPRSHHQQPTFRSSRRQPNSTLYCRGPHHSQIRRGLRSSRLPKPWYQRPRSVFPEWKYQRLVAPVAGFLRHDGCWRRAGECNCDEEEEGPCKTKLVWFTGGGRL